MTRRWSMAWARSLPGVINVSRGDTPYDIVFTVRADTPQSTFDEIDDARPVYFVVSFDRRETRAVA